MAINLLIYHFSSKMESRVQSHPIFLDNSLFHHCLIKILVEDHLKTQQRTWDRFLFQCGFSIEEPIESIPNQTPSHKHHHLILGGSSGSSTPSPQEIHNQIPTPIAKETIPSLAVLESPTLVTPLSNKTLSRPSTWSTIKKIVYGSGSPGGSYPLCSSTTL